MHRHSLLRAGCAALAALVVAGALAAAGARPARASALARPGAHLPQGAMLLEPAVMARATANSDPPGDFPFQTAQSADGLIFVHWYGWYPSFGADFLGTVQRAMSERVQPRLGYGLRTRVDIYTYNSRADFLAGAQPISPAITGAYSVFAPSRTYMPLYYDAADTFDLLAHEMTHITFHQAADTGHLALDFREFPVWFDEGLAVSDESTTSPGYGVYRTQLMQSVRNGGRYFDIFNQFVWSYPQDPDTDDLAYAEAGAFVEYLPATFGADRFHQFITDARTGDLNTAATMDFGADLQTLESEWQVSLGKPPIQHAAGVAPAQTTPTRFTPAHEPTLAGRTRPYGVGGGDDVLATALGEAGAGTGAALLALGIGALWLWRKRRVWRARQSAPPLVSAPLASHSPPPGAVAMPEAIAAGPASALAAEAPTSIDATAAVAPASEPGPSAAPAHDRSKPPRGTPWLEQVALALTAPLALGVGTLWLLLAPAHLWRQAVLAAAAGALFLALAAGVLAWRAWRGGRTLVAQAVTAAVLLALAVLVATQTAGQAGMAQGLGYERDAAYALALNAYADAGAPQVLLAQVHTEWADAAYHNSSDYPIATAQYRAAIALEGNNRLAKDNRAELLALTYEWGKRLSDAHEYQQAIAVFAAQLASPSCDAPCRTAMQERGGAVYLTWAANLIAQKQPDAALAQLRALTRTFPQSKAAASAQQALASESQGLAGVWVAQKAGDSVAMNVLLALVAVRTTDPLQVALASEAPQMVSGTLASIRLYKTPIHVFFLGFHTASEAKAYMDHAYQQEEPDLRVNTISTQTDKNGAFVAWLPAGYVYIPAWEAPPIGQHDDYFSWSSSLITVQPFTPVAAVALS